MTRTSPGDTATGGEIRNRPPGGSDGDAIDTSTKAEDVASTGPVGVPLRIRIVVFVPEDGKLPPARSGKLTAATFVAPVVRL